MSRYAIILVLLVLALSSPASAVDTLQVSSPDPVLEAWRWTAFDRSSGLAGNVRDIFEDREGNIVPPRAQLNLSIAEEEP